MFSITKWYATCSYHDYIVCIFYPDIHMMHVKEIIFWSINNQFYEDIYEIFYLDFGYNDNKNNNDDDKNDDVYLGFC